jgi:hypothetical protein
MSISGARFCRDVLRACARGQILYLRDDAHWNEAGNAVAGRLVAAFLRRRGWANE